MAEVLKKKTEDKYNTSRIKKTDSKSKSKKEISKNKISNEKNSKNNVNNSKEKKGLLTRFKIFVAGVKSEFKRIHWPERKDMVKYSIASIVFIIFCSLFFYLIDIIFALVQTIFK